MSDDLVKRLRGWPISTAANVMRDAADRIEELEERLKAAREDANEAETYAAEMEDKLKEMAEMDDKLAKAVDAIEFWSQVQEPEIDAAINLMQATLAELKGEK